jgi:hypothetical protein
MMCSQLMKAIYEFKCSCNEMLRCEGLFAKHSNAVTLLPDYTVELAEFYAEHGDIVVSVTDITALS